MARLLLLVSLYLSFSSALQAGVLTNGMLSVEVRANGAIDSAVFQGVNFFKSGSANDVSNFGIQIDGKESTFLTNTTNGATGLHLTGNGFNYSGIVSWAGGATLEYGRSYSLVAGLNALRVTTTVTNIGSSHSTVAFFDTFDPDQGFGFPIDPNSHYPALAPFQTYNDVFALAGGQVGQASINTGGSQLTVLVGSTDARALVASGGPLEIASGKDLNKFLVKPIDGNGVLSDKGTHIGMSQLLNPLETTSFTYVLAFGANPNDAQQAFALASVPEPSTLAVFSAIGVCVLVFRRRARAV